MIGKTLVHYEISAQIGRGGMGEVYQAKDTKLGRDVAIKVLPEEFAFDTDRVERFQREAKLLASLNHPNIAAIYGLEESDGTHFLVMELIEGQTLADRIKSGPIPVEEALKLALQIAEALEAAHENGVIHRDLKPANIKVTPDGKVKVLDFGLAKAYAGDQENINPLDSPTISAAATQKGVILGTAAYMSPEQARGKPVDRRADIWAFGVVLYEMLTGKAAFSGDDVTDTLAAVVKLDANMEILPANLHPRVRELLSRCLQKDTRRRYSGIGDARYEIEQALSDPSGVIVQPVTTAEPRTRVRTILLWLAAALVLGGIIVGLAVWRLVPQVPRPIARFSCILPEGQTLVDFMQAIAISPDGSRFVCATNKGLYLRSMDQLQGNIIPGIEGAVGTPLFSPDGQWVGFLSGTDKQMQKIPISGGAPVTICDAGQFANALWSADNVILFDEDGRIMRVSADGGIPEKIFEGENENVYAPQLLPDGTNLLLTVSPADRPMDFKIAVQSLESGTRKELFAGQQARYLDTGHLVYVQGGNLFAVPFDADRIEVTGGPVPIVQDVAGLPPKYAVCNSGALVYVTGEGVLGSERILVWVDRSGKEEAVDAPPRTYVYAHLSPDATRVALDIRALENDIWIWDLTRKTLTRLTYDPAEDIGGIWTPDGTKVVYGRAGNIYLQPADGSGPPELLTETFEGGGFAEAFSPDGKNLLITGQSPTNISMFSVGAGEAPKPLLASKFNEYNASISPDGHWMAYQSDRSGRFEIYVRPFPDVNANLYQISTEGGERPLWNKNGRELFYFLRPGIMMSVPIETSPSFKAGDPKILFKGEYFSTWNRTQYSVTPDGQRFLMIKDARAKPGSAPTPQQINVVLNWFEELKQRVPVD